MEIGPLSLGIFLRKTHRFVGFLQATKITSERGNMIDFNHLRKMAKGMGVNTYRMKKTDIIRAIQKAEHNIECYGTERVTECMEESCLWRIDCVALRNAGH